MGGDLPRQITARPGAATAVPDTTKNRESYMPGTSERDDLPQLGKSDLKRMNAAQITAARERGQLAELLAGRDPHFTACPTCGRTSETEEGGE